MKSAVCRSARLCGVRRFTPSISLGLTEEQLQFQEAAKAFAEAEIAPHAAQWDKDKHFPLDVLAKAGELGFGGLYMKPDYGTGASRLDSVIIFEQLAMACPALTAFITIHNMAVNIIDSFGTEEQRAWVLPDVCSLQHTMSYCLTEPGSGSDAASIRTRAVKENGHYRINGTKCFISGAGSSKFYAVMCKTGEGAKGVSCLIVPDGTPGLSFGANEVKMGWNCQPTRQVIFEDVVVPEANLVGGVEGLGFKMAMFALDGGRINIAACSLGAAQKCLDLAVAYTKERKQFGKSISEFQNTQFKLAEMATKVHASRLLLRQAAAAMDAGDKNMAAYCAMAKMKVTEDCWNVVDEALQLHGGYGYLQSYSIERYLRDLRVHRILEGTNEVMRLIVSRAVLSA